MLVVAVEDHEDAGIGTETLIVPRVVTVTAQMLVHAEVPEILNVSTVGLHTNVGVVTRVTALVGHPVPVIERMLPNCVKKSRIPTVSVPMLSAVKVGVTMPETVNPVESAVEDADSHFTA